MTVMTDDSFMKIDLRRLRVYIIYILNTYNIYSTTI